MLYVSKYSLSPSFPSSSSFSSSSSSSSYSAPSFVNLYLILLVSDLELAVKRWRFGRMSEDERQTRIRRRTVDAAADRVKTSENPARQIEMVGTSTTVASFKYLNY